MKKINALFLLIAIALVFKKLFLPGPLVWGDAPYFYNQGLRELINFPPAWISRGSSLGGPNLFLWIYPLMFIYGFLGTFLHIGNDLLLRLLFYFPSLIFGFTGIYFFTKYLKLSNVTIFFATLLYLVNSYYLLLIDGGQVGVVLAYGLFPFVLYIILKLIDKLYLINFLSGLFALFILTVVDFRIAAICIFSVFLLRIRDIYKLKILLLLSICLIGLSFYWIVPTLKLATNAVNTDVSGLQTTSLLNTLFLSSPNWPANEFGKTIAPYFYFSIVPIFVFLPLFISKNKKVISLTMIFLVFAFLAKGESAPFGFMYSFLVNTKIGSVFRDSTKFFIPLMLIGSILFGTAIEEILKFIKIKKLGIIFQSLTFVFVLFLVWQVVFGRMNGVLGKNPNLSDYQKVYNLISNDSGFLRSAWFTEKSPFAYHIEEKQALDAKDLANFRPFASMNVGTGDRFNFINDNEYLDWFKLLGIKYLIFSGNPRVKDLSKSDQEDWNRLLGLISKDSRLEKLNLGTSFPVYENPVIMPNKFFVDKTFVVLGGDDIYQKFLGIDKNFSVTNQGFIFPEDGRFDPALLQNVASTSAILLFNNKTENDLKMSFLQNDFIAPSDSYMSQWAVRKAGDYLDWKYELLQNNINSHEFDYSKGIAFSSQPNEEIKFNIKIPTDGNYYIEVRSMDASNSGNLKITFNGQSDEIKRKTAGNFEWYEKGPISLTAGSYSLNLENTNGFQVVNTVALVSESEMRTADQLRKNFMGFFQHFNLNDQTDLTSLTGVLKSDKWELLPLSGVSKPGWIIYTDSFDPNWNLMRVNENDLAYPMYSMVNGFYVNPEWGNVKIIFKGDEYIRWGIYFSVLSVLLISIIVLWKLSRRK